MTHRYYLWYNENKLTGTLQLYILTKTDNPHHNPGGNMNEFLSIALNFLNGLFKPVELMFGLGCFVTALSYQIKRNAIRLALPTARPMYLKEVALFTIIGIICLNLFIRLPNPFHSYEGTVGAVGCSTVIIIRAARDIARDIRRKQAAKKNAQLANG